VPHQLDNLFLAGHDEGAGFLAIDERKICEAGERKRAC